MSTGDKNFSMTKNTTWRSGRPTNLILGGNDYTHFNMKFYVEYMQAIVKIIVIATIIKNTICEIV